MRLPETRSLALGFGLFALALISLTARRQAFAASESILWNFGGYTTDGLGPLSTLIRDKSGNLYGTTEVGGPGGVNSNGTVFELTPPSATGGGWTESILANFGTNALPGTYPVGGLVMDKSGNLYGTTSSGGGYFSGTVFELVRPGHGGKWTGRTIFTFTGDGLTPGATGGYPTGSLIFDANGNLYGTAGGGGAYAECDEGNGPSDCPGVVFKLTPPSTSGGTWTETVLWNFGGYPTDGLVPQGALVMDKSGNLYGATSAGGTNGYATTSGYGTVFELTPPSGPTGSWAEQILWNFGDNADDGFFPSSGLIMDTQGNLYGTTQTGGAYSTTYIVDTYNIYNVGGGTAFKLTPPSTSGGSWSESLIWNFGNGTDGVNPYAGVITDASGNLYGTTEAGGAYGTIGAYDVYSGGTVFELTAPSTTGGSWAESVLWNFGNGSDGLDPDAGLVADGNGNFFGTTLSGGAYGGSSPLDYAGTVFEVSTLAGPQITVKPTLVQFPNTTIGTTSTTNLVVSNSGTSQLIGQVNSLPAPFGLSGSGSFNLAPGAQATITLTFTPTSTTSITKEDKVTSNAINAGVQIELHGKGTAAP